MAIIFSTFVVAFYYFLHRRIYGTYVPNTFKLKVHSGFHALYSGFHYVVVSSADSGVPVFIASLLILCIARKALFARLERVLIASLCLQTVYIVAVGGDVFLYGRFFLMVAPITVLFFWEKIWSAAYTTETRGTLPRLLACLCLLTIAATHVRMFFRASEVGTRYYNGQVAGLPPNEAADQSVLADFIRSRITPADGQIGLFYLGSLAYYLPEFRVADFLGKADPVVASEPIRWGPVGHNKWDIRHTLEDRWVSVVPIIRIPEDEAKRILADHENYAFFADLQENQYLRDHFTYRTAAELGAPGPYGLYIRNDLLANFPFAGRID